MLDCFYEGIYEQYHIFQFNEVRQPNGVQGRAPLGFAEPNPSPSQATMLSCDNIACNLR